MKKLSLILASASPRRLELLKQIGIVPAEVCPADIDETPLKNELPESYAKRMTLQKAELVASQKPGHVILAADTVVYCGRRILPKAEDEGTAHKCLSILSGRRHKVVTAVALAHEGKIKVRDMVTTVKFKRLMSQDIERYIVSGEWKGKAGGYAIQGQASAFIPWINGSYSNVVGLPLYEVGVLLSEVGV